MASLATPQHVQISTLEAEALEVPQEPLTSALQVAMLPSSGPGIVQDGVFLSCLNGSSAKQLYSVTFDDCMLGLVHDGQLVRKPWRIVTSLARLAIHPCTNPLQGL